MFLKSGKMKQYENQITEIKLEDNPNSYAKYAKLAQEQGYSTLPLLVREDGTVLFSGFDAGKIKEVLSKELG